MTPKRQHLLDRDWDSTHRPAQVQTRQTQALGRESEHEALPITRKLLETDVPQTPTKRRSTLSGLKSVTRFIPILQGRPHARKYFPTQSRLHWSFGFVLLFFFVSMIFFLHLLFCFKFCFLVFVFFG